MKKLLDLVLNQQNQSNVNDIANQFGIDTSQAQQAIGALIPGMAEQLKQRVKTPQEGSTLLHELEQNQFSQYIDDDNLKLTDQEAQTQGENLLGQIFGNQQEQRHQLADEAARQTGMDSGMLSQMLPMLAPMLMGTLGKQAQNSNGGVMNLLANIGGLDSDGDGRPDAGGIISKLMSFFKK